VEKTVKRACSIVCAGAIAWLSVVADDAFALDPIPTFYQEPALSPNREVVDQHVSERIDPFTGKLQIHAVDLFLPGNGGLDIKVQRSYSSVDEFLTDPRDTNLVVPSPIGVGWTLHFGRVLRGGNVALCDNANLNPRRMPVLELPDGSRQVLYLVPDRTYWLSTTRWRARCEGSTMVVSSPDGTRYEMGRPGIGIGTGTTLTTVWHASRIVDRNGNALELTYTDLAAATAVERIVGRTSSGAPDGRDVVFSYLNNALSTVSDGARVWRYGHVTSPDGGPSYPFLAQVQRPDGRSWRFEYNLTAASVSVGRYAMKTMTYPTGGSYGYLYGRVKFNTALPDTTVVSQKTGSDGNVWRFAYDPADRPCTITGSGCQFDTGSYDLTTITAPDAVYQYAHIGANSVQGGLLWAVGLMLFRNTDGGYEIEQPSFGAQRISDIPYQRPGLSTGDGAVYAPIQTRAVRQRNAARYVTEYSNHDEFGNPRTIVERGPDGAGRINQRTTMVSEAVPRDAVRQVSGPA
jgi:hypothetical protein